MIRRLLDTAANLFVYFCAATLVAELIVAAYLWSTWKLDTAKLARIAAVAQGIDQAPEAAQREPGDEVPPEEVSHDEVLDRRARLFRDLELRELALQNAVAQLALEQRQLAEKEERQTQRSRQFAADLEALKQSAQAEGMEVVRSTLQAMKPEQAKQQLDEMLQRDELDEVVRLLAGMPSSSRAKIVAEFKTEEESEELAEVLRRIRQGDPEAAIVEEAMNRLGAAGSTLR